MMESILKKYQIKRSVIGFISFVVGYELYNWLGSGNSLYRFLTGSLISFITIEVYYTYILKTNPKVVNEEKIHDKDERIQIIKEKAANSTLVIILILLVATFLIAMFLEEKQLQIYVGVLMVFIAGIRKICMSYWNSKI